MLKLSEFIFERPESKVKLLLGYDPNFFSDIIIIVLHFPARKMTDTDISMWRGSAHVFCCAFWSINHRWGFNIHLFRRSSPGLIGRIKINNTQIRIGKLRRLLTLIFPFFPPRRCFFLVPEASLRLSPSPRFPNPLSLMDKVLRHRCRLSCR